MFDYLSSEAEFLNLSQLISFEEKQEYMYENF